MLLTAILECGLDLAFYLTMDFVRDQNATGVGKRFETRSDINALAIDIAALLDNDCAFR